MRRNTLYVILSIITFLAISTVAATCNMCGFSISPTTGGEQTDQASEEDDTSSGENRTTEETGAVSEEDGEDEQGNAEEASTSHSPEIITIIFNGDDITQSLESELLRISFGETPVEHIFLIIAEDTDSDELIFSVEASEGEIQDLHNTGSTTAEFSYIAPATFSGEGEMPYPATIAVSAADSDGNMDVFVIDIGLVPQITAFQLPDNNKSCCGWQGNRLY